MTEKPALATVGDRFRAVRMSKGLTATKVAELLEVSKPAVSTWENNTHEISDAKLEQFAKITEVSLKWLKDMTGNAPPLKPHPAARKLPVRSLRMAHSLVQQTAQQPPVEPSSFVREVTEGAATFGEEEEEARWTIPPEVLRFAFNCSVRNVQLKRVRRSVVLEDGTPVKRGDYLLIEGAASLVIEEPGFYFVSDPEGRAAHRAFAKMGDDGRLQVTIEGHPDVVIPGEGWEVLGHVRAVFHALP